MRRESAQCAVDSTGIVVIIKMLQEITLELLKQAVLTKNPRVMLELMKLMMEVKNNASKKEG